MLTTRGIRRAYAAAGSLNQLIAVWGFVDESTFLTKAGDLGLVYQLAGVDFEGLDHTQRQDITHRFTAALRGLDDTCRVYQYLHKHRMASIEATPCRLAAADEALRRRAAFLNARRGELFEVDLYLVLLSEELQRRHASRRRWRDIVHNPRTTLRDWLTGDATLALVLTDVDRAIARLHQRAAGFEAQLADTLRPTRLAKNDAYRFFP